MSLLDEIEGVLLEADRPLHYRELTECILQRGRWATQGLTPDATVNARLSVDIKKHGSSSRFLRTGKGMFGLRLWELRELERLDNVSIVPPSAEENSGVVSPALAGVGDTLSFTDAAERVLEEFAQGRPMHYRAITAKALELGLVKTQGQTPEATMGAQIGVEIDRLQRRGESPRFVKQGRGFVGLFRWESHGLTARIEQHNREMRRKLHERMRDLSPAAFERLVGDLLGAIGFVEVSVTGRSGDGGIDVRGTLVVGDVIRTRMAVQAKRWRHNVQAPVVQQVRGSLGTHEQGLIITTSDFSTGARDEAARPNAVPVGLMNGEQLVTLLVEHGIGVRREPHVLIELDEFDPSA